MLGDKITIADIQLYFNINGLFKFVLGEKIRAGLPHLIKWFEFTSALPVFLEVNSNIYHPQVFRQTKNV